MIHIKIKTIWQPQELLRKAQAAKQKVFRRGGAIVRGIMRRSMKHSRKKKSAPGQPPMAHTRPGIKGLIAFDATSERAIIGPQFDPSKQIGPRPIPMVLEKGGVALVRVRPPSQKGIPRKHRAKQPRKVQRVVMKPRPFAQPALDAFAKQYPSLWRDAIK